jgi:putative colanic acid biosynthesis acetyltransferase WcaF
MLIGLKVAERKCGGMGGPPMSSELHELQDTGEPPVPQEVHVSQTGKTLAERNTSPWTAKEKLGRMLWKIVGSVLFRPSFHNWYGWRRMILRMFGAKVGVGVRIRPSANIEIPWNLDLGDYAAIGDHAILYSLGTITLGKMSSISQYAHLCAGTHDYRRASFPLVRLPITIGDEAWIAADAFVGPGVTVGRRAIVGARATVVRDVPAGEIWAGNPARRVNLRDGAEV